MKSIIITQENFASIYLENTRKLHIYLPTSYHDHHNKTYPVLYMHDGQNIFHPAFNGQSWGVQHIADQLISEGKMEEIIIVGIENHPIERSNEYNFYFQGNGEVGEPFSISPFTPKGENYEKFLIHEVKPFIDRTYRTKPTANHTALMGSSMGGAITYHIGFRNPDVFSMLGIISPYFYYNHPESQQTISLVNKYQAKVPLKKIWMDIGAKESPLIEVEQVEEMAQHILQLGYKEGEEFLFHVDPNGTHTEQDWSTRVHEPLVYFFGKET